MSKKNRKPTEEAVEINLRYEGELPTQLVREIQAGKNVQENKALLCELLLEPITKLAQRVMRTGANRKLYSNADVEDAVQTFICDQILAGPDGIKAKNGRTYLPYVYRYDPTVRIEDDEGNAIPNSFWGYLQYHGRLQFEKYWRKMSDDQIEKTKVESIDRETGKKTVNIVPSVRDFSIDAIAKDNEGSTFSNNSVGNRVSLAAEIDRLYAEADRMKAEARTKLIEKTAVSFQRYFDEVNALDQGVHSEKAIDERKILSFHLSYAYSTFNSKLLLPENEMELESERSKYLLSRPKSLRAFTDENWMQTLSDLARIQDADYQYVFFSNLRFLPRLQMRIVSEKVEDEPYLSSSSDLVNKVYGWVKTVRGRLREQTKELQNRNSVIQDLVLEEII